LHVCFAGVFCMHVAWIFPGQGAQYLGMGVDIASYSLEAAQIFERASTVLGYDLLECCRNEPEKLLRHTEIIQPAILTVSLACVAATRAVLPLPNAVAGLSLGEYTALVVADVLQFEDAIALLRERGRLMQEATVGRPMSMVAILGLGSEHVEDLCKQVERESSAGWICQPANYNAPGQTVVAGDALAINHLQALAEQAEARAVVRLAVSSACHTSLMSPMADQLALVLKKIPLSDGQLNVISNVTARPVHKSEQIKRLLVEHLTSPVRWADSIRWLISQQVSTFVELGPGSTLSGLVRRIDPQVRTIHIEDKNTLEEAAQMLNNAVSIGGIIQGTRDILTPNPR
jgi:[acyl-carrier-protein] S-malonyltransferase